MARESARRIWDAPDPEWYVARICFKTGPPGHGRIPFPTTPTLPLAASLAATAPAPGPSRARRSDRSLPRSAGGDSLRTGGIPRTTHRGTPRRPTAPTVLRRSGAPASTPSSTHDPGGVP